MSTHTQSQAVPRKFRSVWSLFAGAAAFVCLALAPVSAHADEQETGDPEDQDSVEIATVAPPAASGEGQSRRASVSFLAPFSLNDSSNLLARAIALLPESGENLDDFDREGYLLMLQSVADYLKDRDDLHASLVGYQWERLRSRVVRSSLIEDVEFTFQEDRVVRRVNAISFIVHDEDAILHGWSVYDAEGNLIDRQSFSDGEKVTLRHSLPRQVVYHLWQPTDVGLISVGISRANPQRDRLPVLEIRAGRTNQPEHGKSAIWHINQAIRSVENNRIEDARENLSSAQREIRLYRNTLRVRR